MSKLKLFIQGNLEGGIHPYTYKSNFDMWGMASTFQGVNMYDKEMRLVDRLTNYVKFESDYMELCFKDVTWHNGREISAEDFLYSFGIVNYPRSYMKNVFTARNIVGMEDYWSGNSDIIRGMEQIDRRTIRIHTVCRDDNLRNILVMPIVPQKENQQINEMDFFNCAAQKQPIIGCGAYKPKIISTHYMELERNNEFCLGTPHIERLEIIGGTREAQIQHIKKRQVDFSVIDSGLEGYVDSEYYRVFSLPQLYSTVISLNYDKMYMRHVENRRALNKLVNKSQIIYELFGGHAIKLEQFYPYVQMQKYAIPEYDAVDDAELSAPETIKVAYNHKNKEHAKLVQAIKENMKGSVNIEIETCEGQREAFEKGIDMYINDIYHEILPRTTAYFDFCKGNLLKNYQEFEQLYDTYDALSGTIHDVAMVKKFAYLTHELLPCIPLYNKNEIQIVNRKLWVNLDYLFRSSYMSV